MNSKLSLGSLGLAMALASPVAATPLYETYAGSYLAENVDSQVGGGIVSLWFETPMAAGFDLNYAFNAPGSFVLNSDGTATLNGQAYSRNIAGSGFNFTFTFDQDYSDVPGGVPVFKSVFGAVEPSNNFFLDVAMGSLSGFGQLAGLDLLADRFPDPDGAATQVGGGVSNEIASNQHTPNFGLSTWFEITDVLSANCAVCTDSTASNLLGAQGDVVLDLVPAPVPLPAGIFLLGTALLGAGALSRRKS